MDGIGWGEAADDDASGTALVMELARVLSSPDVRTERSIRFALWNNEETGLNGARAYVAQRAGLQGMEDPPGSGRYPNRGGSAWSSTTWCCSTTACPGRTVRSARAAARSGREYRIPVQLEARGAGDEAGDLFRDANEKYATDYPAAVGHHMTNTDSTPFMDLAPAISVRENERECR